MSSSQIQLERLKSLPPAKREALLKVLHAERLRKGEGGKKEEGNGTGPAPLSVAQRHLFSLDQRFPSVPTYNVPVAVRITGLLNVACLEKSLNDVIGRHDVLRTRFQMGGGHPTQVVDHNFTINLALEELAAKSTADIHAQARAIVLEEGKRPFDLRMGPPIRARVLRLSADEHIALITLHHILCDGQSLDIIMRDLAAFYTARISERAIQLPDVKMQYRHYVDWEARWLASTEAARQIAYWKEKLQTLSEAPVLPLDFPRSSSPVPKGKRIYFELSLEFQKALESAAHECGTTFMVATLAAFQLVLRTWSGQDTILIGAPVDNRAIPELETVVGLFVNTIVFQTQISGDDTLQDVLKRTRETVLSAHAHKNVPFEVVLQESALEHDPPRKPLFQPWFVFQVVQPQRQGIPDIQFTSIQVDYELSRYDVKLNIFAGTTSIKCSFEYNTSLFAPETMERLCRWYQLVLQKVTRQPGIRCNELSDWLRASSFLTQA